GGWFHYVNDPIGTPEQLVDARGNIACEVQRDAWGRTDVAPVGKTKTAIRFQGQYEDEETGLCYNRFRYYDPDTGRFISGDPLGLLGGSNSYIYGINPIGWVDPYGLLPGRNGAFRAAKRDAGIPMGARPDAVRHVDLESNGEKVRDCKGVPIK